MKSEEEMIHTNTHVHDVKHSDGSYIFIRINHIFILTMLQQSAKYKSEDLYVSFYLTIVGGNDKYHFCVYFTFYEKK